VAHPDLWTRFRARPIAAHNWAMSVPAGERRIVSVLIADVVGSTPIAETLGPDRSKYLFDDIVRLMRQEVERFGGTVAQLTGDGILALFGAPVAHEDDSERAVRTALAIREALNGYAAEVAPAYGIELGARVGVNTGPVVVPAGSAPPDVLYNALGDTVNVAARLQALGDLVVGPTTAGQVQGSFELEALGALELKGRSEPVAAFRVTGIREQTAKQPEPRLVGRDDELAALSETLDGLLEGRGSIISITGEPGIGKSRLVAEVKERFDRQVRFLAGHAVSYAETIAYWPIRELLLGWLDLGISDPEARTRLELRAELTRSLAEAGDAHPGREQGLNGAPGPRQPRLSSHPLLRFGGTDRLSPLLTSAYPRDACL
jgi:class 3 adenylate cyclase